MRHKPAAPPLVLSPLPVLALVLFLVLVIAAQGTRASRNAREIADLRAEIVAVRDNLADTQDQVEALQAAGRPPEQEQQP
jgi:hypothetical protein